MSATYRLCHFSWIATACRALPSWSDYIMMNIEKVPLLYLHVLKPMRTELLGAETWLEVWNTSRHT
jgi:hypothetical protein